MFGDSFNTKALREGTGVNAALDAQGRTALHYAAEKGDVAEIAKLLRIGAHPDQRDKNGESALFIAARRENAAVFSLLVEKGARASTVNEIGETPFDAAIAAGAGVDFLNGIEALGGYTGKTPEDRKTALHLAVEKRAGPDVLSWLVEKGVPIDGRDEAGKTALHLAAAGKNCDAAELLTRLGANPLLRDNGIATPLHAAAEAGCEDCARLLLSFPDVRATINDFKTIHEGFTPLMVAAANGNAKIAGMIAAVGGDLNQHDHQKRHSLFIAVEFDQPETVRALIDLGADVEKSGPCTTEGTRMIHWIGRKNYARILLLLHHAGIGLDAQDVNGQTALHKACNDLDHVKAKALLDLGANPNLLDKFGKRPIDVALENHSYDSRGGLEIVSMLLDHRADPDISPSADMRMSPLHVAADRGRRETVERLLAARAPVDTRDRTTEGYTAFLRATLSDRADIAELLLAAGADPLKGDQLRRSALHCAAIGGCTPVITLLLDKKICGIEDTDNEGKTPLHHACQRQRTNAADQLLAAGARDDVFDKAGKTPLHLAAEADSHAIILLIAEKGANLDKAMRDDGRTALHATVTAQRQMLTERLIKLGANPFAEDINGHQPLHLAILKDDKDAAVNLLNEAAKRKYDLNAARDITGWTLMHFAATRKTSEIAAALLAAGIDANARNNEGETPLHIAVNMGSRDMAVWLAGQGADIEAKDNQGRTPLYLAEGLGRNSIVEFLRERIAQKAAAAESAPPAGKPPAPG